MTGRPLWFVVTPVYKPAPGGGAIYTDILSHALAGDGADVVIATEAFPGEPACTRLARRIGSITIERMFALRAGRAERDHRSYLAYARQNLRMLGLPRRLARATRERNAAGATVLVHASLLYNWSILPLLLGRLRRAGGARNTMVLDVRDHSYPASRLDVLPSFDAIVTSSHGVARELGTRAPSIADRIRPIPMPFVSPALPDEAQVAAVLARYKLAKGRYLFNPNGISTAKRYPQMRNAVGLLRQEPRFADLVLVSAGRDRDRSRADDIAEGCGAAIFIGPVPHAEILALMRGALMTLVLSNKEAISRAALEAMSVGGRVILPDLPEFRGSCASFVCQDTAPAALAARISALADEPMPSFDFSNHAPAKFLPLYRSLAEGRGQ